MNMQKPHLVSNLLEGVSDNWKQILRRAAPQQKKSRILNLQQQSFDSRYRESKGAKKWSNAQSYIMEHRC